MAVNPHDAQAETVKLSYMYPDLHWEAIPIDIEYGTGPIVRSVSRHATQSKTVFYGVSIECLESNPVTFKLAWRKGHKRHTFVGTFVESMQSLEKTVKRTKVECRTILQNAVNSRSIVSGLYRPIDW